MCGIIVAHELAIFADLESVAPERQIADRGFLFRCVESAYAYRKQGTHARSGAVGSGMYRLSTSSPPRVCPPPLNARDRGCSRSVSAC